MEKADTKVSEKDDQEHDINYMKTQLEHEKARNDSLQQQKLVLESEIEELTKILFQEANTMVAAEVKQKEQLVLDHKKMQAENRILRERLEIESAQLNELRSKLLDAEQVYCTNSQYVWDVDGKLVDEIFSGNTFDAVSKSEYRLHLIEAVNQKSFDTFVSFLNRLSTVKTDVDVFSCEFIQQVYHEDILPCLSSFGKSKSFCRKIALSMLSNTFCIENYAPRTPSFSNLHETADHGTIYTSENDFRIQSTPESPNKLRKLMSNMTISVTSLPDSFLVPEERTKKSSFNCSLCSTPTVKFRFQLQPSTTWYSICNSCRKCLVASANFFSFIRNIRSNLFGPRIKPMIELYLESAQYRRACFYARSGGADQFFVFSDFLQFQRFARN